jgi:hypothetical protein
MLLFLRSLDKIGQTGHESQIFSSEQQLSSVQLKSAQLSSSAQFSSSQLLSSTFSKGSKFSPAKSFSQLGLAQLRSAQFSFFCRSAQLSLAKSFPPLS